MLLKLRLSVDSIASALTIFNCLARLAIRLQSVKRKAHDLAVSFHHVSRGRLAVNVRCRANVGMAHEKVIFTRPQLISWPVNALKIAVVCPRNLVFAQSSACEVESA
jgi:hypothetical protein